MGSAGIRRRKRRRVELRDPEGGMPPGDVGRLFGRFTWGAYTPAGNLERNGFFFRQLTRNGTRGAWSFIAQAKWVWITIAVAIAAGTLVVHFV